VRKLRYSSASMLISGSVTTLTFAAHVVCILARGLCSGQTAVMDNLGTHESSCIRFLVSARGCRL